MLRITCKTKRFSAALQRGYAGTLSTLLSTPLFQRGCSLALQRGCSLAFLSLFQTQSTKFLLYLLSAYCGKFGVTPLKSIGLPWIYSAVNEIRNWLQLYSINESDTGSAANVHPEMALTQPRIFRIVVLKGGLKASILGFSFLLSMKFTFLQKASTRLKQNLRAIRALTIGLVSCINTLPKLFACPGADLSLPVQDVLGFINFYRLL